MTSNVTFFIALSPRAGTGPIRRLGVVSLDGHHRLSVALHRHRPELDDPQVAAASLGEALREFLATFPATTTLLCPDARTARLVTGLLAAPGGMATARVRNYGWICATPAGRLAARGYWREHPQADRRNPVVQATVLREQFCCYLIARSLSLATAPPDDDGAEPPGR